MRIEPDADEDEAAAIAAAIAAHRSDMEARAAANADADEASWNDRRWSFAGRLENVGRHGERVPDGAPTDPWTASGRSERF